MTDFQDRLRRVRLKVVTGCMDGAGTDSGVWIGFGGNNTYVIDSPANDLERGWIDTFEYGGRSVDKSTTDLLGEMPTAEEAVEKNLTMYIYFTRNGAHADWYLDYVVYTTYSRDEKVQSSGYYSFKKWITQTTRKPNPWGKINASDSWHRRRDCAGRKLVLPDGSEVALDEKSEPPRSSPHSEEGPIVAVTPEPILFRGEIIDEGFGCHL